MPVQTLPYGSWQSSISTELLTAETVDLSALSADGADVYWLEGRPNDNGRSVLVRRTPDGLRQGVFGFELAEPVEPVPIYNLP